MKKGILVVAGAVMFLSSCGSADYTQAAKVMCECMAEKQAEDGETMIDYSELNYASCAIDVMLETRTDINNKDFGKVLEEECSDLKALHDNYVSEN